MPRLFATSDGSTRNMEDRPNFANNPLLETYGTRLSKARQNKSTTPVAQYSELLKKMAEDGYWSELTLLYATDAEWRTLISRPENKPLWIQQAQRLLPEGSDYNDNPFEQIAGRWCFFKGYSSRPLGEGLDTVWLDLGARGFKHYLCCDRLIWNSEQSHDHSLESNRRALQYAQIAAQSTPALGHGLLGHVYQNFLYDLQKAQVEFTTAERHPERSTDLIVHDRSAGFHRRANSLINTCWQIGELPREIRSSYLTVGASVAPAA